MASNNYEARIWNFFKSKGLTDYGVAGLMGNLYAESGLSPINLQDSYERSLGKTDSSYTLGVDNNTYSNFVRDQAGYGIAQWTYWTRKQNLLNYAKSQRKSVGDLDMQLNFLYDELSSTYPNVLSTLRTATSIQQASNKVLFDFESPKDQGSSMQKKRAEFSQVYYNKFSGSGGGAIDPTNPGFSEDPFISTSDVDTVTGLSGGLPLSQVNEYYEELVSALDLIDKSNNSYCSLIDLTRGGEFKFYLPESFTESLPVSWDMNASIPGRSVPPVGYNNSGPRTIPIDITIMAGTGYYASDDKTFDQIMDQMYKDIDFVKSLVYPDYNYTIVQPPSIVLLSCGSRVKLKGVVSSCNVTYQNPYDSNNRAMRVMISFTVSQVSDEPPSYSDIRNNTVRSY